MIRLLATGLLVSAALQAAVIYTDSDFDGVDDANDRCPGTPFDVTVAADGCAEVPAVPAAFFAGIGASYATGDYGGPQTIDSKSMDVTAAAAYGNIYVSVLGAYYFEGAYDPTVADYDKGGLSDIYLSASYALAVSPTLFLTPGLTAKLATADEGLGTGENDYGFYVQGLWRLPAADCFVQYGYTVTGDTNTTVYRDVSYGTAGVGIYPSAQSYVSLSYDFSQSYLPNTPDLQSASLYGVYRLYDTLSLRINYSYGLSDSANKHYVSAMFMTSF